MTYRIVASPDGIDMFIEVPDDVCDPCNGVNMKEVIPEDFPLGACHECMNVIEKSFKDQHYYYQLKERV